MLDTSRVQKELVECNREASISGVSIALHDGAGGVDLTHLCGTISGPVDTPYEGGTFVIDIQLPNGYPFEPPKMQFMTKVCCRSIGRQLRILEVEDGYRSVKSGRFNGVFVLGEYRDNGRQRSWASKHQQPKWAICLDILKDQWSPARTLKTALLSLQALLSTPAPDDPQDAVVAQQNLRDYQKFVGTARLWTESFAKTATISMDDKVRKLVEMGFPEDIVHNVLKAVNGDENKALEKLCSG